MSAEGKKTAEEIAETQDDTRAISVRAADAQVAARRVVNDRYDVIRLLGEGGMGEVHECRDRVIDRSVALKTIRRDRQARHLEARFIREACVQAQLEHPSVVPVFEVGKDPGDNGGAFFTMRKISGIPLDEILEGKRTGDPRMSTSLSDKFSRHRLLTAFAQVCLTVHYAHSRGVLHRDLKPANIMLGDFGEVYVLDWGLAKLAPEEPPADMSSGSVNALTRAGASARAAAHETMAGTALGTPAYMAPEQVAARKLDPRADVFALGAVLFEILTLRTLLDEAAIETRMRGGDASWDARPSVRAPDGMVPPEFDRICVRATAKDIDKRYASARALHDVVEAYLDGERDQELRTKLATSLLSRAEETKNTEHDAAFRHVNRALALAPDDPRGLELLVDLLKETSGESKKARAEVFRESIERQRRTQPLGVALFTVPWLTIYPLLATLRGVKSIGMAIVPAFAWLLAAGANYVDLKRGTQDKVFYPTVLILTAVALTAIPFGPLIIVPALCVTLVANMIVMGARKNQKKTLVLGCLAVAVPMLALLTGVTDIYRFEGETNLLMRSLFRTVRPFNLSIVLTAVDVLMLVSTAFFATKLRDDIERARSANVLFAWQLSKLLPPAISESRRKQAAAQVVVASDKDTTNEAVAGSPPSPPDRRPSTAPTVIDVGPSHDLSQLLDTEVDSAPANTSQHPALAHGGSLATVLDDEMFATTNQTPAMRYVDPELLIEGRSTQVSRVRDRLVGREVAIKRLKPGEAAGAHFKREALLQAHVEHPSVPPIYDLGQDERGPWFTMKLVRGSTLAEILKEPAAQRVALGGSGGGGGGGGNIPPAPSSAAAAAMAKRDPITFGRHQRLTAFAKVCLTIDFAHRHGVVHAALDPTNIVLGEFGEVYVLGWSNAKRVGAARTPRTQHDDDDDAASPSSLRSPALVRDYVAPEQVASGTPSERADIFALGAILYEIASGGKKPSSGDRLPRELDEICAKAMAKDPKDRYATTRKLHDAIESFLSSDRDDALRHDLATERLERAQSNLAAAKDDVTARADVLRNVGRALALAPDRAPALRMLSRLLASPPTQTPPAVAEEIRAQVFQMSKRAANPGALTYVILWNVIFPIFCAFVGVRSWRATIAIGASWSLAAATLWATYRFGRTEPRVPWVAITSALAVGMTSLLFGPYFMVPGLAITITLAYLFAVGREWRWTAVALSSSALIVPLFLMWMGVSKALVIAGGEADAITTMVIQGAVYHPPMAFLIGLMLTNIANVLFVGYYSARFRVILDELEAENRAKIHALSRLM